MFFLGNDLTDNPAAGPVRPLGSVPAAGARPDRAPPDAAGISLQAHLAGTSALWAWLHIAWTRATVASGLHPDVDKLKREARLFSTSGGTALAALAGATDRAFAAFEAATRARGDELRVALIPPNFTMNLASLERRLESFGLQAPDPDAPARAVMAMLAARDIAACDTSASLRAADATGESPYLRFDAHLNERGHIAVAEALSACFGTAGSG